jgi:hypothetical protein
VALRKMTAPSTRGERWRRTLVTGWLVGIAFGIADRLGVVAILVFVLGKGLIVAIVAIPFGLGFLTVFVAEKDHELKLGDWFLLPLAPTAAAIVGVWMALVERAIRTIVYAPICLLLASVGGGIGGLAGRVLRTRRS